MRPLPQERINTSHCLKKRLEEANKKYDDRLNYLTINKENKLKEANTIADNYRDRIQKYNEQLEVLSNEIDDIGVEISKLSDADIGSKEHTALQKAVDKNKNATQETKEKRYNAQKAMLAKQKEIGEIESTDVERDISLRKYTSDIERWTKGLEANKLLAEFEKEATLIDGNIITEGLLIRIEDAVSRAKAENNIRSNVFSKTVFRGYILENGDRVVGAVIPRFAEQTVARELGVTLMLGSTDPTTLWGRVEQGVSLQLQGDFELIWNQKVKGITIRGMRRGNDKHKVLYNQFRDKGMKYHEPTSAFYLENPHALRLFMDRFPILTDGGSQNKGVDPQYQGEPDGIGIVAPGFGGTSRKVDPKMGYQFDNSDRETLFSQGLWFEKRNLL